MSKPTALFSFTPTKSAKSSPFTHQSSRTVKTQLKTPNAPEASPRKCKIETKIESSPSSTGRTVNVRSKLQMEMSPRVTSSCKVTRPSPKKESKQDSNENTKDSRPQTPNVKRYGQTQKTPLNPRNLTTKAGSQDSNLTKHSGENTAVKSMRSCFEPKENRVVSNRPPPSPSPSRPRTRPVEHPITPRTNSVRGILSTKNKLNSPTAASRPPTAPTTPTPKPSKLRRSVSAGSLLKPDESPARISTLTRSSSQTITPKPRVKFRDETTPGCFSPVLLEAKGDHGSGESLPGEVTNLTVAVRVRPLFTGERSVVSVEGNTVKAKVLGTEHRFTYEHCFNPSASQQELFHTMVRPLVDVAFQGYNVCLFAYGQTGTGKTYSMMGEDVSSTVGWSVTSTAGIIPRFCQELFKIIESSEHFSHTKVEISYFEIYNEKIHDLLGPSQAGRSAPLRVREHPELGPYVVDLTVHNVHSFEILMDWLRVGNDHRETAATDVNMNSSRSHAIFTVTLTQSQADDRPSLCSKINLIDLAGSERLTHTCATGDRLKEGVSINRSLLTLGKVISSLAENKKRGFIPYRESVLTWLLRESLGGNSRTAMLATISPSLGCVEETLSTLRYACQARNIVNTVRINESPHEKKIRELNEEIQRLKDNVDGKDHEECIKRQKNLQVNLNQAIDELTQATQLRMESETELIKLKKELVENQGSNNHEECEKQILQLQTDLEETSDWIENYEVQIKTLKTDINDIVKKNSYYENKIKGLEKEVGDLKRENEKYHDYNYKLERDSDDFQKTIKQLGQEINHLEEELTQAKDKNERYEKDLGEMRNMMSEIKENNSHDNCDSQILMLQTALSEAERTIDTYKEKIKKLEQKNIEPCKISNHDGCEKEIVALKCTISELKTSNEHVRCEGVIEKLKIALDEAENLVNELEVENDKLKKTTAVLQSDKDDLQEEMNILKTSLTNSESKNNHEACEERMDKLRKSLSLAKTQNSHLKCEKKISDLEKTIQNFQSMSVHSRCEEKANHLFYAIEKYSEENSQMLENHKRETDQLKETIKGLEDQVSKLTALSRRSRKSLNPEMDQLETQVKILKDENSRIKKKRVDDENKISSLEEQVISLTKELLDVKSQLRTAVREKEACSSLCTQLKEQLSQQDRKLEVNQSRRQVIEEDKENWETPSKVIRRSIARHSTAVKNIERCSLVMKAEEIHQAVKDAQDICTRLKIPWVFHIEPEVTTHSWFDVNLRVWDQRTMSSVRWPRDVFLNWLQEMKDEIMSKSGGQKLFQCASWLKKTKDISSHDSGTDKRVNINDEISKLQSQISTLEKVCETKKEDSSNISCIISDLKKSVTQLKRKSAQSPLKSTSYNVKS